MTTSNSMHAPGPWMVQTVREQTGFRMVRTYVLDGAGGDPVAMVQANSAEEEEANARLIAAAPDLLEALEGLLVFAEAAETKALVGDEGCLWPVECARAAIAKATGEAA